MSEIVEQLRESASELRSIGWAATDWLTPERIEEVASLIDRLTAEIAERDAFEDLIWKHRRDLEVMKAERDEARATVQTLMDALGPFAEAQRVLAATEPSEDDIDLMLLGSTLIAGDLRRALEAKTKAEEDLKVKDGN